jgi:hypothetical protein
MLQPLVRVTKFVHAIHKIRNESLNASSSSIQYLKTISFLTENNAFA